MSLVLSFSTIWHVTQHFLFFPECSTFTSHGSSQKNTFAELVVHMRFNNMGGFECEPLHELIDNDFDS